MKKTPAGRGLRPPTDAELRRYTEGDLGPADSADVLTPECFLCGEEHIGVTNDAVLILKGQHFPSTEFDVPVFLLDPDTKLRILELPNGQLALVADTLGHPTKHAHQECLEMMADETYYDDDEDDEEF